MFRVTVEGDLLKEVKATGRYSGIEEAAERALRSISSQGIDQLKKFTPVRTGNMQRSWKMVRLDGYKYRIENTAGYSGYVWDKQPQLRGVYNNFLNSLMNKEFSKQFERLK